LIREHPFDETLARARELRHGGEHFGADVGTTAGHGWIAASALADGAALVPLLDAVGADAGTPRRDVQASLFVEAYAWRLLLPVAAAMVTRRQALDLDARALHVRFGPDGRASAVCFGGRRFAALRVDAAAGHPDALPVADEAALVAFLREGLQDHAAALLTALNAESLRPARALWRSVADLAAAAFLWAGQASGRTDDAIGLGRALLVHPGPLHATPRFAELADGAGAPRLVRIRTGCCLWWRTAANQKCLTCPLACGSESLPTADALARVGSS
jgi:ferric iron reductase protein FhuF